MNDKILIIGAGQAGMQIADSLREEGYTGDVTMVGEEPYIPYQRPPLSKAFLSGEMDEESLEFRNEHFYSENNITVVTKEKITSVEMTTHGGLAKGASGTSYEFDRLALTTGADPRKLKIPGADLDGVLYMRNLTDAKELKKRWDSITNLVVIGGGFIGLEIAAGGTKAGKNVTVLQSGQRLMGRAVSPLVSDFYVAAHQRRGTTIRLGAQLHQVVGDNGKVTGVELADGEIVPADAIVVGIGVNVRGELADQLALDMFDGVIVVNEFAETSNPLVVAAGDAVSGPHPLGHEGNVHLESVQNAVDQAKVAAKTLAGKKEPYRAVPWFWSDQADLKLQIAGLSSGYDHTVVRGNPDEEKFSVLYYRNGELLAIDAVNDVSDYMAVRRALTAGATIPAAAAADSSVALKTLITGGEA
jgi:3-phenylpropionate/trans-cinnamate dioxygenase ferredoxin reductase subunit